MGQYTDSIIQFLQYALKVLPEMQRQKRILTAQTTCPAQTAGKAPASMGSEPASTEKPETALICSSFFALHPGVDLKNTLSFISSLYKLCGTISAYRAYTGITEEAEVRKLYGCLSSAVDPSRSTSCTFMNVSKVPDGQRREPPHAPCLSDQCRLQLAVLPSFSITAPKLKKYMQFHVDLNAYRYYPEDTRTEYLNTWSDYYLKRYQGISSMEFCAASDSLFGIIAMYASATNPHLTAGELKLLDEACFPWLCGLESLLRAYVSIRLSENPGGLNFCSPYRNLKECEQRIIYFASKAEEACMKLKENSFFLSLVKVALAMYLSDPEANFGMYRLTSSNILKKGSRQSSFYFNGCKLIRFCRIAT